MRTSFMALMGVLALFLGSNCTNGKSGGNGDTVIVIKRQQGEPVGQVGSMIVTMEEVKKNFLDSQGMFKGAPNLNSEKAIKDHVDSALLQKAMLQKAIKEGFFDRSDVMRDIEKLVSQRLVSEQLKLAQEQFVATEAQIKEYYDKNTVLFNRPESFKVAYISIPFAAQKNSSAKEVAALIQKDAAANIKSSNLKEFAKLAIKYADKLSGPEKMTIETNETDYLDQAAFEAKFGKPAFETVKVMENIGQVSPLVTTPSAFVVILKTGYRKAINENLADAKEKISKRLAYEMRGDIYKKMVEDLKKEFEIKIFDERMAELNKIVQEEVKKSKAAMEAALDANKAGQAAGQPAGEAKAAGSDQ